VAKQTQLTWIVLDVLVFEQVVECNEFADEFPDDIWKEIEKKFWKIFAAKGMRIYAKVSESNSVGATNGVTTPYCCIDIDFNTPQFHIYPVSFDEFSKGAIQMDVSCWDSGTSNYFDINEAIPE